MVKRIFILFILFYFLTLLQTSFLVHFPFFLKLPFNIVLIAVIFINLFESSEKNLGFFSAIIGGFFLDFFSDNFIGFNILILVSFSILIKFIIRRYVRIPVIKRI